VDDLAVTGIVGQFRDWQTLGVHRPITCGFPTTRPALPGCWISIRSCATPWSGSTRSTASWATRRVEQVHRLLAVREGPLVLLGTLRTDREAALRGTRGWGLRDRRAHRVALKRRPPRAELEREHERARKLDDPWITAPAAAPAGQDR
jgi:hypothetical protein